MKLMRVGAANSERPVLLGADGRHYDLSPVTQDIDGCFLSGDGLRWARAAYIDGRLPQIDVSGMRIGAPIAQPGAMLCIGQNYAAHAAESGGTPPAQPIMFYKAPNTVVGPYDDILIPRGSTRTDWEVELAAVIGTTARYLASEQAALKCVAGYTICNDLSERDFQLADSGGQWSKGKSCETFGPLGPYLVTADEVGDPQLLGLRSRVNAQPRQDSSTKDMIFGVGFLIWHLSQYTVLEPGDVICTGTPEGVALSGRYPYLRAGDVVEVEIDGLGCQRSACHDA